MVNVEKSPVKTFRLFPKHVTFTPCSWYWEIGDNAVTSSIRIAEVFPDLVGKKTRALWKVYGGMLKYVIHCVLNLAHYMHIFI